MTITDADLNDLRSFRIDEPAPEPDPMDPCWACSKPLAKTDAHPMYIHVCQQCASDFAAWGCD